MSIAEIGEQAAEATARNDDADEQTESDYERFDLSDAAFIKVHPGPTAIEGTSVALRYSPPFTQDGEFDEDGRGDVWAIIENPTIPEDESTDGVAIFEGTGGSGDDYKVVNTEKEDVDVYDAGVSVGSMYESDQVDEFDIDGPAVVKLSTSAGRSVARTLDVKGLPNADVIRTEDGDPEIQENGWPTTNNALVEKHPRNREDGFYEAPRYARDPQLRPEVEGESIILLVQEMANVVPDYDGNSHWATVLADVEDERMAELAETYADDAYYDGDESDQFIDDIDGEDYLNLAPTAEFEPDEELVRATGWLEWHYPDEDVVMQLRDEQGVTVE